MRRKGSAEDTAEPVHIANGTWRCSSYCTAPDSLCLEVHTSPHGVRLRDSKNRGGPVLRFTHDEWRAFVLGVRNGEFDT
jgi:hypothetical protein